MDRSCPSTETLPGELGLIRDERETGVTLHYMVEKPDRGDIVAQRAVPITDADTALTLFHKLTEAAAALMRETYPLLCGGVLHAGAGSDASELLRGPQARGRSDRVGAIGADDFQSGACP